MFGNKQPAPQVVVETPAPLIDTSVVQAVWLSVIAVMVGAVWMSHLGPMAPSRAAWSIAMGAAAASWRGGHETCTSARPSTYLGPRRAISWKLPASWGAAICTASLPDELMHISSILRSLICRVVQTAYSCMR